MLKHYESKDYTILVGDALQILKGLRDKEVNLTVTSPPYWLGRGKGVSVYADNPLPEDLDAFLSYDDYIEYLAEVFGEIYRLTCAGGYLCINVDDIHLSPKVSETGFEVAMPTHSLLTAKLVKQGWRYKGLIIWQKLRNAHASGGANTLLGSFPYPTGIPVVQQFEFILLFRKDGRRKVDSKVKEKSKLTEKEFKEWCSTGIWTIPPVKDDVHPCPYPEEIPLRLIKLYSFCEDLVLDPFAGVGTTGVAALKLGRRFLGIELYQHYAAVAALRLSSVTEHLLLGK